MTLTSVIILGVLLLVAVIAINAGGRSLARILFVVIFLLAAWLVL